LSIAWSAFSWEAFATLTTGVVAVAAAWWVGYNQVKLQKRHTTLIENDLKIQLLEKRSACVNSMRDILYAWQRNSRLSEEEWRTFYRLSQDAVLLYPKQMNNKLDQAVDGVFRAKHYYSRSQIYRENGDQSLVKENLQKSFDEEDKLMKIMPELLTEMIEYSRVDFWK
jgi:hypothetical protein